MSALWVYDLPATEENVIGPDHRQREQPVHTAVGDSWLYCGKSLYVSKDELSPSKPLFVALAVAPERVDPLGQLRVLAQVLRNYIFSAPLLCHPCNNKRL